MPLRRIHQGFLDITAHIWTREIHQVKGRGAREELQGKNDVLRRRGWEGYALHCMAKGDKERREEQGSRVSVVRGQRGAWPYLETPSFRARGPGLEARMLAALDRGRQDAPGISPFW